MKKFTKRLNAIRKNLSGFKDEKDRRDAIQYLRTLDPDIKAEEIETHQDFIDCVTSFFAPLPNTDAWDNWLGTDQHKKYMERQKRKQEQQTLAN